MDDTHDRPSDPIDAAQETAEFFLKLALKNQRQNESRTIPEGNDCEDCGVIILPARREAQPYCTRCIACQSEHEINAWR